MKKIKLGSSNLMVPAVAVGCMRLTELESEKEVREFIEYCLEKGANFFDHADIYGGGRCEKIFGEVLKNDPAYREQMILQSKCGIVPGKMYDLSAEYIVGSTEKILERLSTDHLDLLVLHRPDALLEPEEIARAFDTLEESGKVTHFGVSNFNSMQIELLKKYVKQPILVDQLQLSIASSSMISQGMEVNMTTGGAVMRDGSVLDYCRLNDITIQTWSPFQMPEWRGTFIGSEEYPALNEKLNALAEKYDVTATTIAAAWILRHPADMQILCGSMKKERLQSVIDAAHIRLTREEWYDLYLAANHILP